MRGDRLHAARIGRRRMIQKWSEELLRHNLGTVRAFFFRQWLRTPADAAYHATDLFGRGDEIILHPVAHMCGFAEPVPAKLIADAIALWVRAVGWHDEYLRELNRIIRPALEFVTLSPNESTSN